MNDDVNRRNELVIDYCVRLEAALARMTGNDRELLLASWKSGVGGRDFGLLAVATLAAGSIHEDFGKAFGKAVGTRAFEMSNEFDADLRPMPDDAEERVVMGEFEGAILYYVPGRHRYRVELGIMHEEFHATWEPLFGMDVADVQVAEEVLDRLLAAEPA